MEKRIHTSMSAGSRKSVGLAGLLLLATVFHGVAADELHSPFSEDFAREIRQQGAAALQEMTRDLQQTRNWSKLGVKELETTMKQGVVIDDQVANTAVMPECEECIDCHHCRERS